MSPRDRHERAENLEREAEHTGDPDTWIVASDAWLEAGDATRAWYARLRSDVGRYPRGWSNTGPLGPGLPLSLIGRERAAEIARAIATVPNEPGVVTNEERGALELFRFVALQPERVFAYYSPNTGLLVGDDIRTFMGDYLGRVVHRGRVTHPFGNRHARIQHVQVRAINGYDYRGTCALDTGTYCKLRRADPWLR